MLGEADIRGVGFAQVPLLGSIILIGRFGSFIRCQINDVLYTTSGYTGLPFTSWWNKLPHWAFAT